MTQKQSNTVTATEASASPDPALISFHQGTALSAHRSLAPHRRGDATVFRVWAPHAEYVALTGDFTEWNNSVYPMQRITEGGIWETQVPTARLCEGQAYKYFIRNGCRELYKVDPFGVYMETPPKTASLIRFSHDYQWRDAAWINWRKGRFTRGKICGQPIHIYQLQAGAWKRHEDGSPFRYPQLAAELVTYAKQMGYTHVELMPLAEYPCDTSSGYLPCGFYAPTSRYGTPNELMSFVDTLHEAGIGVILNWSISGFAKDAHGLFEFDGQPLYEYKSLDRMECPNRQARRFDLGRGEVKSFLLSNALFWIEAFHLDGLHIDAADTLLYPDNAHPQERCPEATEFFRLLNRTLCEHAPDVMLLADRSDRTEEALGFTLTCSTEMMNGLLAYQREDPLWRKYHHEKLTPRIGERQLLALSHAASTLDGRALVAQLPGDPCQALANARVLMTYVMTFPAKKLSFMGNELGQRRAWTISGEIDWGVLEDPAHAAFQLFCAALNHFYLESPALWELDGDPNGFAWIDAENRDLSIYSYLRKDRNGRELLILLSFTPVARKNFLLSVPADGVWEEVLSTEEIIFGGKGRENPTPILTQKNPHTGDRVIRVNIPPMSASIFRRTDRRS